MGICPGGIWHGGYCPGYLSSGHLSGWYLSGVVFVRGYLSGVIFVRGGICSGGICPRTIKWVSDTESISIKMSKYVGVINRLKYILPLHILLTLYNTLMLLLYHTVTMVYYYTIQ